MTDLEWRMAIEESIHGLHDVIFNVFAASLKHHPKKWIFSIPLLVVWSMILSGGKSKIGMTFAALKLVASVSV
jgi:hypothetical protein